MQTQKVNTESVHPKYINPKIMEKMLDTSEDTKKASSYMINENSMKVVADITQEQLDKGLYIADKK